MSKPKAEKPRASRDECLMLIQAKREAARVAMEKFFVAFKKIPVSLPDITTLLEYLSNNVYCIELMLKVLSDDWDSHRVGTMYQTVFGHPHSNQKLMNDIKGALESQKYLYEPSGGLLPQIAGLEELYREVFGRLNDEQNFFSVQKEVKLPREFIQFLYDDGIQFRVKNDSSFKLPGYAGPPLAVDDRLELMRKEVEEELALIRSHIEQFIKAGASIALWQEKMWTLNR